MCPPSEDGRGLYADLHYPRQARSLARIDGLRPLPGRCSDFRQVSVRLSRCKGEIFTIWSHVLDLGTLGPGYRAQGMGFEGLRF